MFNIWDREPYYRPERSDFTTINTTMYQSPQPVKGETWYIKVADSKALTKAVITDVTAHTVEYKTLGDYTFRYCKTDVQFVEKVYQ